MKRAAEDINESTIVSLSHLLLDNVSLILTSPLSLMASTMREILMTARCL